MNQKTIVWGLGIIIIIALGLWYFSSSSAVPTDTTGGTATTSTTGTPSTPAPAGASTFKSIFTQSGNHQCSYASSDDSASTQSTSVVYISGGKMRAEFRTSGATVSANFMIYNGGYLYTWKEGASVGKKSSIKSLAELPQAIPQDLTSGAIFGTASDNVSWDCHPWITDATYFTIPTYVKFS